MTETEIWLLPFLIFWVLLPVSLFFWFHAMQSTLVFGAIFVADIILGAVIGAVPILNLINSLFNTLVFIVALIVWIVSMLKAFQGQMFKWPVVGNFAERQISHNRPFKHLA